MIRPGKMLKEVLKTVFKKPATLNYPFVKSPMPDKFRGKLLFHPEKCIGCQMCVRDCPANAIQIKRVGDKKFEAHIDLAKCIYCGQCVDSCMKKALEYTKEFELASLGRDSLKIIYHAQANSAEAPKDQAAAQTTAQSPEPQKAPPKTP